MLENHQTDHDLRGHGDFRIAFHCHDIVIIIVTQISYSSSVLLLSARRCTTSIKEAHFPFNVQLACLSSNLSHSVCLASSKTKGDDSLFLSSSSVFSFSSPSKIIRLLLPMPLLYFTHLSSLLKSMWLSVRQSVFHWSNPHLKEGWHVIVADSWSGL